MKFKSKQNDSNLIQDLLKLICFEFKGSKVYMNNVFICCLFPFI